MNRRNFIIPLKSKESGQDFSSIDLAQSGLAPYSETWNNVLLTHLLKRNMFGAKKTDTDYFQSKTMSQIVNELINTVNTPPLPPINNYNSSVNDPDVQAGSTWVNAPISSSGTIRANRRYSLQSWWLGLQINQSRSIEEKMVLFWHNHFVTESPNIDPKYLYIYNTTLRKYALGNFKSMVKAITLDPAMLIYLNGNKNVAGAPNENYARELQELFTMGKGPNSLYTESDVQAAAKVLTGFDVDATTSSYIFRSTKHDATNKQFSAFYNNTVITGRTGASGEQELDDFLNMLFNQQELSLFICRKIYRFFIYYIIDDNVEANVIAPLAQIFRNNNYEIKPVLQALFSSEHFFDANNIGCMIKSPIDYLVGMQREFNVVFPDQTLNYVENYYFWRIMCLAGIDMSQELGNPPNVAGWPAYYQVPEFHELWINSNTLPRRNIFSDVLISKGYTKNSIKFVIDPIAFVDMLSNPYDPNQLIIDSLAILYMIDISLESKDYLKIQILMTGQITDGYWTTAWTNYKSNPTDATYKNIVLTRLQALFKYLMDISEYQLS